MAPEWARGFPLDFLKEAAALYKAEFKAHTYGAFGCPKERDVADARAAGQLIWTKNAAGEIEGIAMFRHTTIGSTHKDFAGRQAKMLTGDLFVRSIAGSTEGKRHIIQTLADRAHSPAIWVEGHVENRELVELLTASDFRPVMTKISASSDLKGLWLRAAPDQFGRAPLALNPADVPGVKILAPDFLSLADLGPIMDELDHLKGDAWAQHYSNYNKRQSWTSFALAGYDQDDPSFIIKPSEMSKDWKLKNPERMIAACLPTIMAKHFPATMRVVDRIPGRKQRIRFMRLAHSNGELSRHSDITDPGAGTQDGQIARLHIPIHTDPRCLFRSWGLDGQQHRLHFPVGALCYIDTRKPHAVVNPSDVDRIHLVVDAHCTPELRRLLAG